MQDFVGLFLGRLLSHAPGKDAFNDAKLNDKLLPCRFSPKKDGEGSPGKEAREGNRLGRVSKEKEEMMNLREERK